MGKKFIDKRRAATFQLLARDSVEPGQSSGPDSDHVFVRVDNNPVMIDGFEEDHDNDSNYDGIADDPDSIFADAPEDGDLSVIAEPAWLRARQSEPLPDHIRREILELGFPDDGYNYLTHMREIKNSGGGLMYYQNPKPNLDQIPLDVKAYDASKVRVQDTKVEVNEKKIIYTVAKKTKNVRVQKAVDPEVIALLDENDSQFGSDVEDLEEDFVVQANLPEEDADLSGEENDIFADASEEPMVDDFSSLHMSETIDQTRDLVGEMKDDSIAENLRGRRLLDEQFDLLEAQEYATDSDNDYGDFVDEEEVPLEKKLSNVLKDRKMAELELDGNYKTPAGSDADVLRRCAELAEKFEQGNEDDHEVIWEESSDESEAWDCETIVSTYSNLDNRPGIIPAPENTRKKKLAGTISDALKRNNDNVITLRGKERMPVDYLPHGKTASKEKVKVATKTEPTKRRQDESKEEKKERKAAVKKEKKEARVLKKETKEIYRDEAKRAQRVASVSGPASYRLM